jgi:hypothetical protein
LGHKAGVVRAWRSSDGQTWKTGPARTGIDGTVRALVATGGGIYLAAGTAARGCDVAIWTSSNGFAWTPSEALVGARGTCTTGSSAARPVITLLRDGPAGVVAFGSIPGVGNATWTSPDRVHWTFHPQPSLGGTIAGLSTSPGGYVAVGDSGTGSAAVWSSADGATWTPAPDQDALHGSAMTDVARMADGSLVAVGSDTPGASANGFVAWTSTDGVAWQRGPAALGVDGGVLTPAIGPLRIDWRLATDGHASTNPSEFLIAVGGGYRAIVSPPTTPSLRAGSLTVTLSGLAQLATKTVTGTCSAAEDGTSSTAIQADVASSSTAYQTYLVVTPDGQITDLRVISDGFTVGVGQGQPIDPSLLTVAPGSNPQHGSAEFRGLADINAPAGSKLLSGSVAWACAW